MCLFTTGILHIIGASEALVAWYQRNQGFNETNPMVFWGGQIIILAIFVAIIVKTLKDWDESCSISKSQLWRSILLLLLLYALGHSMWMVAPVIIAVFYVFDAYAIRKRAGFVRIK